MGGSSKGSTSTSQVTIPPEVLAQYSAINQKAASVDSQPFQSYSGQFVAPVNAQQQTGIAATNAAATAQQPYYNGAAAYDVAGGSAVNPTAVNQASINQYLSPYLQDVVGSESALLNQNNQQQQSGQLGTAISSGAFGGDRAGIAAANLSQQQNLANASIYSNLLNTGYNTALSTAQQQQGVQLSADQANRAALQQTGQSLQGLGTAAQTAGLAGASAQTAAGTLEQQTQQAQDSALYNQFLQQQSLPYQQLAQEAGIAEGTGSLSGSTTTTNTTNNGIFSDSRLKDDIREIGRTFDGQKIYDYKYKNRPEHHIGLMAGEVERKHPDAVGLASGYKTVDYKRATDNAAKRGHFADGGMPYASDATDALSAKYQQMYGSLLGQHAPMVPATPQGSYQLHPAQASTPQQQNFAQTANQYAQLAQNVNKAGQGLGIWGGSGGDDVPAPDAGGSVDTFMADLARGGRAGLATGGDIPYDDGSGLDVPDDSGNYTLIPAKPPQSSGSGDSALGDIGQIASIVSMFANGGRIGRADGGVVPDIDPATLIKSLRSIYKNEEKDDTQPDTTPEPDSNGENDDSVSSNLGPMHGTRSGAPSGLAAAASLPAPKGSGHVDSEIVSYMVAHGVPKDTALGIAAGVNAESGNNPGAKNGSSGASYLGQWLGARKDRLESMYGKNPTKQEQLDYLLSELKGGDRGGPAVLAANDAPGALQAYITKFMRPKAGSETQGDLARGMGALRNGFADGGVPTDGMVPDAMPVDGYDPDAEKKRALAMFDQDVAPSAPAAASTAPAAPAPAAQTGLASTAPVPQYNEPDTVPDAPAPEQPGYSYNPDRLAAATAKASPDIYGRGQTSTDGSFIDQVKHGKADAILSILSGLGAAATTNTNNPLTALFSGLGAGAQAYQGQRAFEQDRLKQAQEMALQRGTLGVNSALASGNLALVPYQAADLGAKAGLTGVQAATGAAALPYVAPLAAANIADTQAKIALAKRQGYTIIPNANGGGYAIDPSTGKTTFSWGPIPPGIEGGPAATTGAGVPAPSPPARPGAVPTAAPAPNAPVSAPPAPQGNALDPQIDPTWFAGKSASDYYDPAQKDNFVAKQSAALDRVSHFKAAAAQAPEIIKNIDATENGLISSWKTGAIAPGAGGEKTLQWARDANAGLVRAGLSPIFDTSGGEITAKLNRDAAGKLQSAYGDKSAISLKTFMDANPGNNTSIVPAIFLSELGKHSRYRDQSVSNFAERYVNGNPQKNDDGMIDHYNQRYGPDYWNAQARYATATRLADHRDVDLLFKNKSDPATVSAFTKKYDNILGNGFTSLILGR